MSATFDAHMPYGWSEMDLNTKVDRKNTRVEIKYNSH